MSQQQAWDIYFASLMAMRLHPRNEKLDVPADIKWCADIADLMLKERATRWRGSEQQ